MKNMESLMAVNQETEGIIGKFFYYSTSSILIPKLKFIEIGRAYGLPKFKPAKESKAQRLSLCHNSGKRSCYSKRARRYIYGLPYLLQGQ